MFARCTSSRFRSFAAVLLASLVLMAPAARAEVSQSAVDAAHAFLKTEDMGKSILSFVHFGADYKGHAYSRTIAVVDEDGKTLPDKFALVYRFHWEDDGVTDVAFLCNSSGKVYGVQVMKSNAVVQQPFAIADLTIQVVGDAVVKAAGDDLSEKDRSNLKRLIDAADSHGLLVVYLKFKQLAN